MAIVEQHEEFQSRDYNEGNDQVTYSTSYVVRCDSRADGLIAAAAATILPVRRVSAVNIRGRALRCSSIRAQPVDNNDLVFRFTALWGSKTPELTPNEQEENPLKRKPEVSWSFASSTEGIFEDMKGRAITTSAGEQYDPPVEVECADPSLVYTVNAADYDPSVAIDYCGGFGSINSDSFLVPVGINGRSRKVAAGSACCRSITGDANYENGIYYMRVRIEMLFRPLRPSGRSWWDLSIVDEGTLEWVYSADNKSIIGRRLMRDSHGSVVNGKQKLDGFGRKLQDLVTDPVTGAVIQNGKPAVYRTYPIRRRLPYAALQMRFP